MAGLEPMCPIYPAVRVWVYQKEKPLKTFRGYSFHLEGMKEEGLPIPLPSSEAENLVLGIA